MILNDKNLIPFTSEQSREEAKKNGSKGGKKSGEARRRRRDLKNTMKMLLSMPVADVEMWNALAQMGVPPENIDNHTAIVVALMQEALSGDVKAFKEIRSLLGEDTDNERLKLSQKEMKLKETKLSGDTSDGKIVELIEGLKDDLHE